MIEKMIYRNPPLSSFGICNDIIEAKEIAQECTMMFGESVDSIFSSNYRWIHIRNIFHFKNQEDAFLFQLRWG